MGYYLTMREFELKLKDGYEWEEVKANLPEDVAKYILTVTDGEIEEFEDYYVKSGWFEEVLERIKHAFEGFVNVQGEEGGVWRYVLKDGKITEEDALTIFEHPFEYFIKNYNMPEHIKRKFEKVYEEYRVLKEI